MPLLVLGLVLDSILVRWIDLAEEMQRASGERPGLSLSGGPSTGYSVESQEQEAHQGRLELLGREKDLERFSPSSILNSLFSPAGVHLLFVIH